MSTDSRHDYLLNLRKSWGMGFLAGDYNDQNMWALDCLFCAGTYDSIIIKQSKDLIIELLQRRAANPSTPIEQLLLNTPITEAMRHEIHEFLCAANENIGSLSNEQQEKLSFAGVKSYNHLVFGGASR